MKALQTIKSLLCVAAAFGAMALQNASASSTYGFVNITNNSSVDVAGQLRMVVAAVGTTQASFTFYNDIGIGSSITDIYFDDIARGNPFGSYGPWSDSGAGVEFTVGADPANLPGGNGIGFTATYSGDSDSPVAQLGVNKVDEWVSIIGTFSSTNNFNALLNALDNGTFRVGLKVQSIDGAGSNDSDGFVNVSAVPLPAAAWLFGSALFGFMMVSNRRKV